MCTAITYKTKDFYFGRTLDYELSFGEEVTIVPRNFPLVFRETRILKTHYSIIGTACIKENYPLFYDAVNEKGLCMAGLNFVGNAHFNNYQNGKDNVAVFEFIPWILGQCESVADAKRLIEKINISNVPFGNDLPVAQLHWIIADRNQAITLESTKNGINIYSNPVGILTNNPTFNEQMFNLNNYMHLSPNEPINTFAPELQLQSYSRGMGALGLPGDLSSQSRFVRAAFTKLNSVSGETEKESVGQFFHIMDPVQQQRGCCNIGNNSYEITLYTSCCNADKGIYYYTTYNNRQITGINMHGVDIDSNILFRYPMINDEQIKMLN